MQMLTSAAFSDARHTIVANVSAVDQESVCTGFPDSVASICHMDAAGLDIPIADAVDTVAGTADVVGADDTDYVTEDVISSAMDESHTDDKRDLTTWKLTNLENRCRKQRGSIRENRVIQINILEV